MTTNPTITRNEQAAAVDELEKDIGQPLYTVSAVFPFDLFPDKIIIYRKRVDFIYRHFFWVEEIIPIMLEDIISSRVSISILFASLEVEVKGLTFLPNSLPPFVNFLPIEKAKEANQILTSLLAANNEGLDADQLPDKPLADKLQEIGKPQDLG